MSEIGSLLSATIHHHPFAFPVLTSLFDGILCQSKSCGRVEHSLMVYASTLLTTGFIQR